MDPEVLAGMTAIKEDRQNGAAFLAAKALCLLALAASRSRAAGVLPFMEEMETLVEGLAVLRPSMTPLVTATARWLHDLRLFSSRSASVGDMREAAVTLAGSLTGQLEEAGRRAASAAADLVHDAATVMSCSYSATVAEALCLAGRRAVAGGRPFQVVIAYSQGHGERLAAFLQERGVLAETFAEAEVEDRVRTAGAVLVGADSVLQDGSIINGTPTLALARAALAAQIPFYVVADSFKRAAGEVPLEEGFDLVGAEFISAIATEEGAMPRGTRKTGRST